MPHEYVYFLPTPPGVRQETGRLRLVSSADPAADAEISLTVPGGRAWRILSLTAELVADSNAATRSVALQISIEGTMIAEIGAAGDQTANEVMQYTWGIGLSTRDQGAVTQNMGMLDIPFFMPGMVLATATTNRQSTDNWGRARLLVIEYEFKQP